MPTIKMGVVGTHSTGKSSLICELGKKLIERGMRVSCVGDLAKQASQAGFPILKNHTFESTLWIMSRGIAIELEASMMADVVLVDRAVPDALSYLFAALKFRRTDVSCDERKYLLDLAKHHAQTYSVICKTVLNPSIPLAPGRDPDMAFRHAVASELDEVFLNLSLTYRLIEPGTEFIDKLVDELKTIATASTVVAPEAMEWRNSQG
jgi:hypothetical protein